MFKRFCAIITLACLLAHTSRADNAGPIVMATYAAGLATIIAGVSVPGIKPDYGVCEGSERKYCCAEGKECIAVSKDTTYCERHMKEGRLFCTSSSEPGQPLTSDIRMNSSFKALTVGSTLLIGGLNALIWEHPVGFVAVCAIDLIFTRSVMQTVNKKPWVPVEPMNYGKPPVCLLSEKPSAT